MTHFPEELHFPAFNGDAIDRQQRLVVFYDVFTDCCAPQLQFETVCLLTYFPQQSSHMCTSYRFCSLVKLQIIVNTVLVNCN